jgi:CheY-like chemotaxis protein
VDWKPAFSDAARGFRNGTGVAVNRKMFEFASETLPPDPTRPTVLIVEDEQIARHALSYLLNSCGFRPAACASAEEALAKLEEGTKPLAALVDVDLPGMSGLELITRMEERNPGMVTVLITAAEGDRIDRFRKAHEVHYLRKPVNFSRLLGLLTH